MREPIAARGLSAFAGLLAALIVLMSTARCSHAGPLPTGTTTLRIGVGALPLQTPLGGVQQVVAGLSLEGLARTEEDGRVRPNLAESWEIAPDQLSIEIHLRKGATFHDGVPVTAEVVAQSLQRDLPVGMGTAFADIARIAPLQDRVRIELRRPSRFLLEALETSIQEPGKKGVSTGPYIPSGAPPSTELRANASYYLGRPTVDRVTITPFSTIRNAWAELLRGNVDMLHEVNIDALDSLQASSDIAVFSFVRHYQYMIMFSTTAPQLQSADVRRELSAAIDRTALVKTALNGHGIVSFGPIPPNHWALSSEAPRLGFNRDLAIRLASRNLKFTCLVPADSAYERVALAVKQQLAAVNVDMRVQEVTQTEAIDALNKNRFEALLGDPVSGPTVFRSYRHWYSKALTIPTPLGSSRIDAALEMIQHAASDADYVKGVTAFQAAVADEPPAIFLAWPERVRAVSRRFHVEGTEQNGDILNTLRLWRPAAAPQVARTN